VETSGDGAESKHPLLASREEKRTLYVVVTSDRGLCGSFNSNICKRAERLWHSGVAEGRDVQLALIGRKGRDYFRSRKGPVYHQFEDVWDNLGRESARHVARKILRPFLNGEVDAIYLIYNEFKSAMSQEVIAYPLFPLQATVQDEEEGEPGAHFIFEPDQDALLLRLVPMYVEITILRALYESMASELGARMTAMDAATKNASDMIADLTLQYNRVRQAAITTELLEIIGGAEALQAG
jgi:F-type H+-transporting ATPase subunit gamma